MCADPASALASEAAPALPQGVALVQRGRHAGSAAVDVKGKVLRATGARRKHFGEVVPEAQDDAIARVLQRRMRAIGTTNSSNNNSSNNSKNQHSNNDRNNKANNNANSNSPGLRPKGVLDPKQASFLLPQPRRG